MAIIRWRTLEEHERADLFGLLDGIRVSYDQFQEIHERLEYSDLGRKIKKISYNKLLSAVREAELQLINEEARGNSNGTDLSENLLIKQGMTSQPSIQIGGLKGAPIMVKLSIMKVEAGIATIHLFFPLTGKAGGVNLVFKKLGFGDDILNGGSLKLDIPVRR